MKSGILCFFLLLCFIFPSFAKDVSKNDLPKRSVIVSQSTVTVFELFIYLIDLDTSELVIIEYVKGDLYKIIHTGITVDQKEQSKVIVESNQRLMFTD